MALYLTLTSTTVQLEVALPELPSLSRLSSDHLRFLFLYKFKLELTPFFLVP